MKYSDGWQLLIISLTGASTTPRVRIWRALKSSGAVALRDGVYLLPNTKSAREIFSSQAESIKNLTGSAYRFELLSSDPQQQEDFVRLFDRRGQYTELMEKVANVHLQIAELNESEARKLLNQMQRDYEQIVAIDFYPDGIQADCQAGLTQLRQAMQQQFNSDEPHAVDIDIPRLDKQDFLARLWATRRNLWVDRVASAWLIKRFIDPEANFLWLDSPDDCPAQALGFDFNGASFSHVGHQVTFEVLLVSFGLENDVALARLARVIHYLDVGGVPVSEAEGLATIMTGIKSRCTDDESFLLEVGRILDDMYSAFTVTNDIAMSGAKKPGVIK